MYAACWQSQRTKDQHSRLRRASADASNTGTNRGQSWETGTTNGNIWRELETVFKEPARSSCQFGLLVCDRVNKESCCIWIDCSLLH